MKSSTRTQYFKLGSLIFATCVCLMLQNSAEGLVCQLTGDMVAWRNRTIESIFYQTYYNITLAANISLAKLVTGSNFSLTTAIERSFRASFYNGIWYVKDGDLPYVNWNTSTYGMFGPNGSIPTFLIDAIGTVYVRPLYTAFSELSRTYKYPCGLFRPPSFMYSAKGIELTNATATIVNSTVIYSNTDTTTLKSSPYYIPENDCYADNRYLVNVTIFNNFTILQSLLYTSSSRIFPLGELFDRVTEKFEEYFRSSGNPFQGRFLRANVFTYLEGTLQRNASALVELYFVNAYDPVELRKLLDYEQFSNPLRYFLGVNYTYYKPPVAYKGELRMYFPFITNMFNATTTSTSTTTITTTDLSVVINATSSTTSTFSSTTSTPLNRWGVTNATSTTTSNNSSTTSTPSNSIIVTRAPISNTTNSSSTTSAPPNPSATNTTTSTIFTISTPSSSASTPLNTTTATLLFTFSNFPILKEGNFTSSTAIVNKTTVTVTPNATSTTSRNITTTLNAFDSKVITTTVPRDDVYYDDYYYNNNSTNNGTDVAQNFSSSTTVNQSSTTVSLTLPSTLTSTLPTTSTLHSTLTSTLPTTTSTLPSTVTSTLPSTLSTTLTTGKNGTFTNSSHFSTPTSEFTISTTVRLTTLLNLTSSSTVRNVTNATTAVTPTSTSTSSTKRTDSTTTKYLTTSTPSTTQLSTRTTVWTTMAQKSTTVLSTTTQRWTNLTSASTKPTTVTIPSTTPTVKQSSATSTATTRKFTNVTVLTTKTTANPASLTTFDPDPFFKPVAPVIRKVYNDKVLVQKYVTMPPMTDRKYFYTIALPAGLCMILFSVMCLFCLNIDCVPPRKTLKESEGTKPK